jgi:polar amino acid transport system permease protein
MDAILRQFFNIDIMVQAAPLVFRGLSMTLLVCAAVVPLGLAGGLMVALAGRARSRGVRFIVALLIDVFRAAPPLVLLIFVHAGLPFAGLRLSPFASVCVAFFLNNSAYYGEIYRAGLDSVGAGQREAARSTGLTAWQAMAYVVIPRRYAMCCRTSCPTPSRWSNSLRSRAWSPFRKCSIRPTWRVR